MPPANVPPPVIAPRSTGLPRPVRSPVSDRPSEKAMLTPAPRAVAAPVKNAVSGWWVASTTANIGARVDSDPSISPLSAGWTRLSRNDWLSVVTGEVSACVIVVMSESFLSWVQRSGREGEAASYRRVIRGGPFQAPDLEQFQAQRLDAGQCAMQRGLVRQDAGQQRVLTLYLGVQVGERGAHRPAQPAADADLIPHRRSQTGAKRAIENRHRTASRIEKVSTAGKVPVNPDSTPTPTTGMIRPAYHATKKAEMACPRRSAGARRLAVARLPRKMAPTATPPTTVPARNRAIADSARAATIRASPARNRPRPASTPRALLNRDSATWVTVPTASSRNTTAPWTAWLP